MSDISNNKEFLAYEDDNGEIVSGYFEVIERNNSFIAFKSHGNIIRIPWHRILKNKERDNGE